MALEVGTRRERHLQDFGAPFGARVEIRRVLDVVLGVHVRARRDQRARYRHVVAMRCREQRGAAALAPRLDADALRDQALHARKVALGGKRDERLLLQWR